MNETRKDIFGNVYSVEKPSARTFEQRLREAKAKQKYKQFQAEQRAKQIASLKRVAQRSKRGFLKLKNRATDKRLPSLKDKFRGSIYGKDKM